MISTDSYKGVRDFYPEDMAVQNYIFDTWKKVAREFNYQEYSASPLEYAELYRSKGSDEIVNDQMYTFTDKGDREVALRPEMTPTLARMIAARRKGLKLPLRWFSIPNVFRYEKPQRGRKREHFQLNCDIMGAPGVDAEVEIITLSYNIMKAFGAKDEDFVIHINDRAVLNKSVTGLLKDPSSLKEALRLIDGKNKMSPEDFNLKWNELSDQPFNVPTADSLTELQSKLTANDVKNIVIDSSLTRGFDYYTGMVFEVFDTNPENKRSLFGGGRYDNLLEMFGVEPLPTVGFGMGDVTIRDFLETHNLPLK
jgi:histidyl-tRNA synthetase